jgi:hypothetical protein
MIAKRIRGTHAWLGMGNTEPPPPPPTAQELITELRGHLGSRWEWSVDIETAQLCGSTNGLLNDLEYAMEHRASDGCWSRAVQRLTDSVARLQHRLPWPEMVYVDILCALHHLGRLRSEGRGL